MNLYGPAFFDDAALIAEIQEYVAARKKVVNGDIAEIGGEGRRVVFTRTKDRMAALDLELREMLAEARRRGLEIGGVGGGAIAVETGR